MLDMPYEDLVRDLRGNVVMHKNKPVYVEAISPDGSVRIRDMLSQRSSIVQFNLDTFQSPRRLGFINTQGSVVYGVRTPVRKYYLGLSPNNIKMKTIDVHYPSGKADTRDRLLNLSLPEVADALMNKYPSIQEAAETVKKFRGACAFDKQFALSSCGRVYYKNDAVGNWQGTPTQSTDIVWFEDQKHLSLLLDNNHEKTVRDFRPTLS